MPDSPIIPIICGPTGSGKTSISLNIAGRFPIEVISADSRQVYRHLNIGTAKPTPQERATAKVHCIDLIEPGERYSAYQYIADAKVALCSILEQGKLPVVVGGTGLYIQALIDGVVEMEDPDPAIRERLETEMSEIGPERMHARLEEQDPVEAARVHPNNKVRVVRALEIIESTGKSKSELMKSGLYRRIGYDFRAYCLTPPRERLYEAIGTRVDQMMALGLLEELQSLVDSGRAEDIRQSRVIGYAELLDALAGKISTQEATDGIKQNTRRFAKRQMTWFRHQLSGSFFGDSAGLLQEFYRNYPAP